MSWGAPWKSTWTALLSPWLCECFDLLFVSQRGLTKPRESQQLGIYGNAGTPPSFELRSTQRERYLYDPLIFFRLPLQPGKMVSSAEEDDLDSSMVI